MNTGTQPPELPRGVVERHSVTLKMVGIALLALLLLIPLGMIRSLVRERQQRRDETVHSVTATWRATSRP